MYNIVTSPPATPPSSVPPSLPLHLLHTFMCIIMINFQINQLVTFSMEMGDQIQKLRWLLMSYGNN